MRPIVTPVTNHNYGPPPGVTDGSIGDLPCQRVKPGEIRAHYAPREGEEHLLPEGWIVEVGIYTEPIPPIHVALVKGPEPVAGSIRRGAVDAQTLTHTLDLVADRIGVPREQLGVEFGKAFCEARLPSWPMAPIAGPPAKPEARPQPDGGQTYG